jgi:hypothetical protein
MNKNEKIEAEILRFGAAQVANGQYFGITVEDYDHDIKAMTYAIGEEALAAGEQLEGFNNLEEMLAYTRTQTEQSEKEMRELFEGWRARGLFPKISREEGISIMREIMEPEELANLEAMLAAYEAEEQCDLPKCTPQKRTKSGRVKVPIVGGKKK